MTSKNYAVTYQNLEDVPWTLRLENDKKYFNKLKKIAKSCDIKKLKINPWPTKIYQ